MGQYFLIVDLDKKEFVNPHVLGMGRKLCDIPLGKSWGILPYLLTNVEEWSNETPSKKLVWVGHWAKDKIVYLGDYEDPQLASRVEETFKDISWDVRDEYEQFFDLQLPKSDLPRLGDVEK